MGATRDCKHGQLSRSCEVCELEAENEALRARRLPCREAEIAQARYEKAEAERDELLTAVKLALMEIGFPTDDYPAPVVNAWVLLKAVLDRAVARDDMEDRVHVDLPGARAVKATRVGNHE